MNSPQTMRALVLETYGAPFRNVEIARPVTRSGEVLVRVKASGTNPLDLKIRTQQAAHAKHPLPAVLGIDLAGVVEEVGPGVLGFLPGDEVYGMTGGVGGRQGSLAEFAAVDATLLAHKPANLSMREAAAMPLVFITAWEGLVDRAGVKSGQTVLVHGGGGGVGHMAVQIARSLGARVYATDSAEKADFISALGATPIDYRTVTLEDYVKRYTAGRGFDVVYDTNGGATLDASFQAVARYGHVVSSLGWGTHALAPLSFRAATYSGVFTLLPLLTGIGGAHHGEILREATALVEAGKVKPCVNQQRFGMDQVEEAHASMSNRTSMGKVVVEIS